MAQNVMVENQIDPRAVWLRLDDAADQREFFLVVRKTDKTLSDSLPFGCGKLPDPFSSRFCHVHDAWRFSVPTSMSNEDAFKRARQFGFRTDDEDVLLRGDPGHIPIAGKREKVFSARRRIGRPGEGDITVIFALDSVRDGNGVVKYDALPLDEFPPRRSCDQIIQMRCF